MMVTVVNCVHSSRSDAAMTISVNSSSAMSS